MTLPETETLRAVVFSLAAAALFTAAFLATKDAFLPKLPVFKMIYSSDLPVFLTAMLFGATFSAMGMVAAGLAFEADMAIAAPTLATAGLLGNIFAGMYLDQTPVTPKLLCICLIMAIATVFLVGATKEAKSPDHTGVSTTA